MKKKETCTAFINNGTDEEKEVSRVRCKFAKKVAKSRAYDRLYQKLKTKEGKKEVFKLARVGKEEIEIWTM